MTALILKTNDFESILITKAQDSWVWDTDGKKYLDCVSGTWTCNLGHKHSKVLQDMKKQMDDIIHRCMRFHTPTTLKAAEQVLNFLSNKYDKITFLNSGSEAMEFAISFARNVSDKTKILSLRDSYLGAFGVAKESSYTSTKASKLKIPYPECDSANCNCLDDFDTLIDHIMENYSSELACFVLEPIMVSGGIHKACNKFISKLCQQLQSVGVLVIANEVTTGFGRSGLRFGHQHFDIDPDIVVMGKALGNGYPVSAIATRSVLESKLSHSNYYYAQSHQLDPLGTAVANSVVGVFKDEQIIEKSQDKIKQLNTFFKSLSHPFIKEVRSYGMIFGVQIQPVEGKTCKELILEIKDALLEEGVLIGISLGKELLRLLPSLTITDDDLEFFKKKFVKVLDKVE